MTDKEWKEYKENLQELKRTVDLAHLKSILIELSANRFLKINLRESPLNDKSPSDITDMLEELGWEYDEYESNGWEQDTWILFSHEAYNFCLVLVYSGYYWTMELYRSDIDD